MDQIELRIRKLENEAAEAGLDESVAEQEFNGRLTIGMCWSGSH